MAPKDEDTGAEAPEDLRAAEGEVPDPADSAAVAPSRGKPSRLPPPQPPHTQVNLGIALQQTSLENLPHDIQKLLIESADQADQRGYQYAESALTHQGEAHGRELQDRADGRRRIIWAGGLLAAAILIAGSLVTYLFINAQQYQMAQTVMVGGISAIGGFLGGLGAGEVARRFAGSS